MKVILQKDKIPTGSYLWRYVDLHKLLSFINTKAIVFARMDKFSDDLEGISAEQIKTDFFLNKAPDPVHDFQIPMPNPRRDDLKKIFDKEKIEKETYQKSAFVSCWYLNQRESLAMWNLYSNKDSVALKIDYHKLCSALISEMEQQAVQFPSIKRFITGKIRYRDIINHNPVTAIFDTGLKKAKRSLEVRYRSFRKDDSYKHENEYRFCIISDGPEKESPFIISPSALLETDVHIVFHPQMDAHKKDNIRTLINRLELKYRFSDSEISGWIKY